MFTLDYWLTGILRTCELIVDGDAFVRTWIEGDYSITSIHYYGELFEQLAGDLHLDECVAQFEPQLRRCGIFEAVSDFALSLHRLDRSVESGSDLKSSKILLASPEWVMFQAAAQRVLEARRDSSVSSSALSYS
jgi:hypothetical protein